MRGRNLGKSVGINIGIEIIESGIFAPIYFVRAVSKIIGDFFLRPFSE